MRRIQLRKKKKQEEETVAPHWLIRIKNIQRGKKKTRKKAQPLFFYSFWHMERRTENRKGQWKSFSELKVKTGESRRLFLQEAKWKELEVTQFYRTPSDMPVNRKVF